MGYVSIDDYEYALLRPGLALRLHVTQELGLFLGLESFRLSAKFSKQGLI